MPSHPTMFIRRRRADEPLPWPLLLDADPSRAMVERYVHASDVYLLCRDSAPDAAIGVVVLTPLEPGAGCDSGEVAAADPARASTTESDIMYESTVAYEIKNIAVLESEQGKGHGRRLLHFAIDEARTRGARWLYIGTGNSSLSQLHLYQRVGFRIVGVDSDFFARNYSEPLFEDAIECRDMLRLRVELASAE